MPAIVQISIVAVAVAVIALAIEAIRAMRRFEKVSDKLLQELTQTADMVQRSMTEVSKVTSEAHELVSRVGDAVPHITRIAAQAEKLGDRVFEMSSSVVDEVEGPLRQAVAVVRGVRAGATHLMQRLSRRMNGGAPQEG